MPTPSRGLSATLVQRGGDRFLVDCGEGTQRQLIRAAVGITQIQRILLTHYHADHFFGLFGMFKTWQLWGRTEPVEIYGPRGLTEMMDMFRRLIGKTDFSQQWREVSPGQTLDFEGYQIQAIATEHRIASCGYLFVENPRPGQFSPERASALGIPAGPMFGTLQHGQTVVTPEGKEVRPDDVMGPSRGGRRIVITGDTRPCQAVVEAARGADVLIHEATFLGDDKERAQETSHSTAAEAAAVARAAGVRLLALTHLSFRHSSREVLAEARGAFEPCVLPNDFDRIVVPFPEKGMPYLVKHGAQEDPAGLSPEASAAPPARSDARRR